MFLINYFAVLIALVAYTILGMLWYGPLWGKKWIVLSGMSDVDMNTPEMKKARKVGYVSSLISGFVAVLTTAVVMKLAGITGPLPGLLLGAGAGFGFVSMTLVGEAAWHNTPWGLVGINAGYRTLGLAVSGLIIGLW